MHGKPAMLFFQYQAYLYVKRPSNVWNLNFLWLKSHYHVKCYTRQTSPAPHCRQPSPILYGSITYLHLLEENSIMVKLTLPILENEGNPV